MASQQKQIPKDALVISSILKELGVTEYEPRVINQLLEFTCSAHHFNIMGGQGRAAEQHLKFRNRPGSRGLISCYMDRYVTSVLEDAKVYANHAKKKLIDLEDVRLAVQMQLDKSFTNPPPRDILLEVARLKNNSPLPLVKPHCGIRLPPDRYCLNSCNYRLKSTAPKKFGHSATYSMQQGGMKGPSMGMGMGTAVKGPQIQLLKRPPNTGLTTVPRTQSISTPKPVIKFSPAAGMHNTVMTPKPKIQIATAGQVEIKMEMDEHSLKRKREPEFDVADH